MGAFQQAIRLDPQIARYHQHLGQAYMFLNQFDKALPPLKEAARLAEKDSEVLVDLGRAYLNLRQYTQAVATFSTAVQLNPPNATAQF